MSAYEIYFTLHVLMAIVWLGGGLANAIVGWRLSRTRNPDTIAAFGGAVEWTGTRVFTPASLILLGLGFLMIEDGHWSYRSLWIVLALVLYAVTFLTGVLFLGPQSGRLGRIIREEGADSPRAAATVRRLLLVARLDLVVLYVVAADMLIKPTGDDIAILVAGGVSAAALIGGIVFAHVASTPGRHYAAP